MIKLVQTTKSIVALIAAVSLLSGCSDKVSFSSSAQKATATDDEGTYIDPDAPMIPDPDQPPVVDPPPVVGPPPVEPPPVTPPPVEPPPVVDPPPVVGPPPVEPPPVTPPPVEPPPVVLPPPVVVIPPLETLDLACPTGRNGSGALTSCLSCPAPVVEPDLSSKAKRLLDTMERACQVPNRGAPEGYVAPTRAELMHRLRACSPQIYPDTVLTPEETGVIPPLASGDAALLRRMFGGLWYQPPYSDAFDHYFGLGVEEAVPLFCYKTKTALTGELWSREMWDWSLRGFVWEWPRDLQALHAYYQHVRSGLVKCLDQEGSGGPTGAINNGSMPQAPTCTVKAYRGVNRAELRSRTAELLASGHTVSLESSMACMIMKDGVIADGTDSLNLVGLKCE
ncbi:MAG: hypothetical protein AB7N80_13460 [Bdellovibrionales bacterium]